MPTSDQDQSRDRIMTYPEAMQIRDHAREEYVRLQMRGERDQAKAVLDIFLEADQKLTEIECVESGAEYLARRGR